MKYLIEFESHKKSWYRTAEALPARGDKVRLGYDLFVVRDIIWEFGSTDTSESTDKQEILIFVESVGD